MSNILKNNLEHNRNLKKLSYSFPHSVLQPDIKHTNSTIEESSGNGLKDFQIPELTDIKSMSPFPPVISKASLHSASLISQGWQSSLN